MTKYEDLKKKIEFEWLWQNKTRVIPVVIGSLGAITKHLVRNTLLGFQQRFPHKLLCTNCKNSALFGTACDNIYIRKIG